MSDGLFATEDMAAAAGRRSVGVAIEAQSGASCLQVAAAAATSRPLKPQRGGERVSYTSTCVPTARMRGGARGASSGAVCALLLL